MRFGDPACTCRVDTPTSHQKRNRCLSTKLSWLFDKFSNNNASDDGLFVSVSVAVNKQISEVIFMLGNNAILMTYQINACLTCYAILSPLTYTKLHTDKKAGVLNT